MVDLDGDIHAGIELLVRDAPRPTDWDAVQRRHRLRRRRRTVLIGAVSVGVVLALIAAVARVSSDGASVVAGPAADVPCGGWVAVHTLFDSSANTKTPARSALPVGVTAEQAAFLVKSGDVPDRVAKELGGGAAELSSRVVVRTNPNLGTIQITAWGESASEARHLTDTFAESLLASVQDIQQRELDRQRDVLNYTITQLEIELAGVTVDDPGPATSRDRLNADIAHTKTQLQELDQAAAQGSNIYSFGSSEAFQPSQDQLANLFDSPPTAEQKC